MKVTIKNTFVEEKQWQKGDRSGVIRTQEAVVDCERFRQTIRLDLGKSEPAYPIGEYALNLDDNVVVSNFGDLQLARRLKLVRVADLQPPKLAKAS